MVMHGQWGWRCGLFTWEDVCWLGYRISLPLVHLTGYGLKVQRGALRPYLYFRRPSVMVYCSSTGLSVGIMNSKEPEIRTSILRTNTIPTNSSGPFFSTKILWKSKNHSRVRSILLPREKGHAGYLLVSCPGYNQRKVLQFGLCLSVLLMLIVALEKLKTFFIDRHRRKS